MEEYVIYLLGAMVVIGLAAWFINLGTAKQLSTIKSWLLYAVTVAEEELGSGTGQLKLLTVYNMFIEKFKIVSLFLSFDTVSGFVDDVLDDMKEMLSNNAKISECVYGTIETVEDSVESEEV